MSMSTVWKGYLRCSMVTIPLRLYNAVDQSTRIRFNQLHEKDHGRVGYDKTCKSCGDVLAPAQIVKGYEFAPEQYVVVSAEDLEKLRLKSTRVLEIEGFVGAAEIDTTLYDTPYLAGPDGDVATKGYALLAEALRRGNKMGVGKLVLREREDMVLIGPRDGGLMIYKVRYPQFIRQLKEIPSLELDAVNPEELQLAQNLVDVMSTTLAQIEWKDSYHEAVKEIIEAKVAGTEIVTVAAEEHRVVDIMVALKESIARSKKTAAGGLETPRGPKQLAGKKKGGARKTSASKKSATTRSSTTRSAPKKTAPREAA